MSRATTQGETFLVAGWLSFCLVVRLCVWFLVLCLFALRHRVGCWVVVSGALVSSLVVGCCPCLPGSSFCAGFREKGRRPKNRSRRFLARDGLFQVFPCILALLGGIVAIYSPSYQLRQNLAMGLLALAKSGLSVEVVCLSFFSSRRSLSFAFVLTLLVEGCVSPCTFYVIPTILAVMNRTWVANLAIFRRR